MIPLNIILDGDNAWTDLRGVGERIIHIKGGKPIQVAVLPGGMLSGRPSVGIRIDLPNGQTVIAETSARLFCTAARAIMARYPDLFEDKPNDRH